MRSSQVSCWPSYVVVPSAVHEAASLDFDGADAIEEFGRDASGTRFAGAKRIVRRTLPRERESHGERREVTAAARRHGRRRRGQTAIRGLLGDVDARKDAVDDVIGREFFRFGFVGRDDAMAKDSGSNGFYVFDVR